MNIIYLFTFVLFLNFYECLLPWTKKNMAVNQMNNIKDMSKELKKTNDSLPTEKEIVNKIHKLDNEIIEKLNEDIINEENLIKHKPHVCDEITYKRDYSFLCPEGWEINSNGQCWGINYDGHCEALHYFQEYSEEDKHEFELNCCVSWPKLKVFGKKIRKDVLRGSINSYGQIIPPTNI